MRVLNPQGMAVVAASIAYEVEMKSSAVGLRAHALLQEVRELEHRGELDTALFRRREAVALFAEDDDWSRYLPLIRRPIMLLAPWHGVPRAASWLGVPLPGSVEISG